MIKLFLLNIFVLVNMIWANDMSDSEVQKFRQDVLMEHNKFRSHHQVPILKLNPELNKIAQDKAIEFLKSDTVKKTQFNNQPLGINKYKSKGTHSISGKGFTDYFYAKGSEFDYTVESLQNKHGFTQIVWKSSREIGLGVEKKGNTISIVAVYFPAGNVNGIVLENVQPIKESDNVEDFFSIEDSDNIKEPDNSEDYESNEESSTVEVNAVKETTPNNLESTEITFTTKSNEKIQENRVIYQINIENLNMDKKESLTKFNNEIIPQLKQKLKLESNQADDDEIANENFRNTRDITESLRIIL